MNWLQNDCNRYLDPKALLNTSHLTVKPKNKNHILFDFIALFCYFVVFANKSFRCVILIELSEFFIRPRALFSSFLCSFFLFYNVFIRTSLFFIKLCVWILDLGCVPMFYIMLLHFTKKNCSLFFFVRLFAFFLKCLHCWAKNRVG